MPIPGSIKALILLGVIALCVVGPVLAVGLKLAKPAQAIIGPPPTDLDAESVQFLSASGAVLHGWLSAGRSGGGLVVLIHGVRANRLAMLQRALVLKRHGFGVLLFDLQAHGESEGRRITFGYLEGLDATAAVAFAKQRFPSERIGVIGISLGGAAALLGPRPLDVDALVLESVFPDIYSALTDRLRLRLGPVAILAAPIFAFLMPDVLGVGASQLRPIDHIGSVTAPLLIASGTADAHTTITEARALFARAPEPKQFWPVEGAAHVDLERHDPAAYWQKILPFLTSHLQQVTDSKLRK